MNSVKLQLGKQGLTPEFIGNVKKAFENVESVRISLLKGSGRDREKTAEIKDKILEGLGPKYTARVIGFTIVLRKWRKARR